MLDNNVRIIKHKVGLLNLAKALGNKSKACKSGKFTGFTYLELQNLSANRPWNLYTGLIVVFVLIDDWTIQQRICLHERLQSITYRTATITISACRH